MRASAQARPDSWDTEATAGSAARYGSMTLDELKDLPVKEIATPGAHLYLWTTNAFIEEAHALVRSWDFRQITIITWVKVKKQALAAGELEPSRKSGYYYRGATEHVIFGVRGSCPPQTKVALPTAIISERLPHSVKPDEFYEMVEAMSPDNRIELFARTRRDGWLAWGDEAPDSIDIHALASNPFLA